MHSMSRPRRTVRRSELRASFESTCHLRHRAWSPKAFDHCEAKQLITRV
jgi:hypothetical protein